MPLDQRHMFHAVIILKRVDHQVIATIHTGQGGFGQIRHMLCFCIRNFALIWLFQRSQPLRGNPRSQFRNGNNGHVVLAGKHFQLGAAGHCAVLVQNFANDGGRF